MYYDVKLCSGDDSSGFYFRTRGDESVGIPGKDAFVAIPCFSDLEGESQRELIAELEYLFGEFFDGVIARQELRGDAFEIRALSHVADGIGL